MPIKPAHYVQLRVRANCLVVVHDVFEDALHVPWHGGAERVECIVQIAYAHSNNLSCECFTDISQATFTRVTGN